VRLGQIERRRHDYVRRGTTSLFAALDIATAHVIGRCYQRQRAVEFRKFLSRFGIRSGRNDRQDRRREISFR
jgi:hypothetical protein